MTTPTPEPLPGLEVTTDRQPSELGAAIRRTISAYHDQGLVSEVDAARLQLALTMAHVVDLKVASGRMSTIGHDARVLMDLLDKLADEAGDIDDDLRDAMQAWGEATGAPQDLHAGGPDSAPAAASSP